MKSIDVLIVGAGPFGLSVSAHLRARDVDHLVVGTPMDTWRAHCPAGMLLKSEPFGSDIASPQAGFDLNAYYESHGLGSMPRVTPLTLGRILEYADWFTARLVPDVRDDQVTEVTRTESGFLVAFAGGESVRARQVVIATGVLPYRHIPAELSSLPSDLVTHTSDHHRLEDYSGRKVVVVGSGQSALETAALLHEQGAEVRIVARTSELSWAQPGPGRTSLLGKVRRPESKLCPGWPCKFWDTPTAFRLLPREMQATKARTVLGPSGSWWLRERVDGIIETFTGYQVRKADPGDNGVRLFLDGPKETVFDADHVVAGTGFRINLARLAFLQSDLRSDIATFKNYPVVSRVGESSVPNFYFAGAPTAANIGPSVRFIAGTHNVAKVLANHLALRTRTLPHART